VETALGIEILGGLQVPNLRTGGENNRTSGGFATVTASQIESGIGDPASTDIPRTLQLSFHVRF
jgi:hypothetical protein